MAANPEARIEALRIQGAGCRRAGSALYAELLARAADDAEGGGPIARVLEGFEGHAILDAMALRLLGAVHREVLAGRAPRLAPYYPSAGGTRDAEGAWQPFRAFVCEHEALLRERLREPLQTNEVQRAAALLPGFLTVAARSGLPLRCREIGASAGLLLGFDRFGYRLGEHALGPRDAELVLEVDWQGPPPPRARLELRDRAGCDLAPVDLEDPEERLRLASYLWPDQPERFARLARAIAIARQLGVRVERASAARWLEHELATLPAGTATVLYQSVMWQYLSEAERANVTAQAEAAGARASDASPFFWLRMEGSKLSHAEIRLRSWPGGADEKLAETHYHASWIRWQSES